MHINGANFVRGNYDTKPAKNYYSRCLSSTHDGDIHPRDAGLCADLLGVLGCGWSTGASGAAAGRTGHASTPINSVGEGTPNQQTQATMHGGVQHNHWGRR